MHTKVLTQWPRAFSRYIDSQLDQQTNDAMRRGLEQLIEEKLIDRVVKEGDRVPDFELPDGGGKSLRLSAALRDGPVVLVFYRGVWSPYCTVYLNALQYKLGETHQLGAHIWAISPQTPDRSHSVAEQNNLQFPVLSDVGNHVARALGLVHEFSHELRTAYKGIDVDLSEFNGDDRWALPVPSTFIINQDGTIAKAWADVDCRRRVEPEDVVSALREFFPPSES